MVKANVLLLSSIEEVYFYDSPQTVNVLLAKAVAAGYSEYSAMPNAEKERLYKHLL